MNVMYSGDRAAMNMQITDFAVDRHTHRGRQLGSRRSTVTESGLTVYDESLMLVNQVLDDPYEAEARALDGVPPWRSGPSVSRG